MLLKFHLNRSPLPDYPFYMIFETSGSNDAHDQEKLNDFLKNAMDKSLVIDGVVTNESAKMRTIWEMRERIAESLLKMGYCFKYDISLPLSHFYEIVPVLRERLGSLAKLVTGYGHVGMFCTVIFYRPLHYLIIFLRR
jgi:D-2-hydroxyglutarate dehydrogenase